MERVRTKFLLLTAELSQRFATDPSSEELKAAGDRVVPSEDSK